MENIMNAIATLTANFASAPVIPTAMLQTMKSTIIAKFSINSVNDFAEIENDLDIIEHGFGQLCANWRHEEREQLKMVYNWHINHGLAIPSELVNDMKKIASEIEQEVTKKLIGSITLNQLSQLLG